MKRAALVLLTVVMLAHSPALGRRIQDEWLPAEKMDQALEAAAKKDVPVAIIYRFRNSDCPLHNGKANAFQTSTELKRMIRVLTYTDSQAAVVGQLRRGLKAVYLPMLLLTDGQGHLIGFVPYEGNHLDLVSMAKQAQALMAWKKKTRKTLAKIEKQIEAKQYAAAKSALDDLEKKDRVITGKVHWSIKKVCAKLRSPRGKAEPIAKTKKDSVPAKASPAAQGDYFHEQTSECRRKLKEAVDEAFERVEKLLAAGDLKGATASLRSLSALKGDEAVAKKCADLQAQIKAAKAAQSDDSDDGADQRRSDPETGQ